MVKTAKLALLWWIASTVNAIAQTADEPLVLPPTIIGSTPPKTPRLLPSLAPRDPQSEKLPEKVEKPAPKSLVKSQKFDAEELKITKVDSRLTLTDGRENIRDFGFDKATADETLYVMRQLGINEALTIPGSRPLFQIWLKDGQPVRAVASRQIFIPMISMNLRAESVGGVWVVTDGARAFFDFGEDATAAKQAASLLIQYKFNQMGLIGNPRPTVMYAMYDKFTAEKVKNQPINQASALTVLDDVVQKNLLLPGNVVAGPKTTIDQAQLQTVRGKNGEWTLVHNETVLGKFGSSEHSARNALKALQEAKITEMVSVGDMKFPIFLAEGQPMRGRPLGSTSTSFRPEKLKLQQVRDRWWIAEDYRPYIEAGSKADAELLLKTIRHLHLSMIAQFGFADTGGMRFLTTGY